jgi:hypothetical protein
MFEHAMTLYEVMEVTMSVRKRAWKTDRGESRSAWVVDYTDQLGRRCHKTFERKKDADTYHAKVAVEVGAGIHTPDSRSITVAEAGELWLKGREAAGIEPLSFANCRGRLVHHIVPLIGATKPAAVSVSEGHGSRGTVPHKAHTWHRTRFV